MCSNSCHKFWKPGHWNRLSFSFIYNVAVQRAWFNLWFRCNWLVIWKHEFNVSRSGQQKPRIINFKPKTLFMFNKATLLALHFSFSSSVDTGFDFETLNDSCSRHSLLFTLWFSLSVEDIWSSLSSTFDKFVSSFLVVLQRVCFFRLHELEKKKIKLATQNCRENRKCL